MGESITQQIFEAKWIANGFPKSGTHLLAHMLRAIAPYEGPTESGYFEQPWAGTYFDNSWSMERQPLEKTAFHIARISNGHMIKAHLAYDEELARFIYLAGIQHVIIVRDLRDVAVSQAFHIIQADNKRLSHPEPDAYDRDDFDAVLLDVILGKGRFPGVVRRFAAYAPWLDDEWTSVVHYEYVLEHAEDTARDLFVAAMSKMGERFGVSVSFDKGGLQAVAHAMAVVGLDTRSSPTFRRGSPGNWREYFNAQHSEAFLAEGGEMWLDRLGYTGG